MSDSVDPAKVIVEEPDPRFRRDPIPDTVDEVVARIVEFVGHAIDDAGGPAYRFNVNAAEADFKKYWGEFIANQLRRPTNPWPSQWKNIVHVAKEHGKEAVKRAKAARRKPVSREDFVEAGKKAAGYCLAAFGREAARGCWCNPC